MKEQFKKGAYILNVVTGPDEDQPHFRINHYAFERLQAELENKYGAKAGALRVRFGWNEGRRALILSPCPEADIDGSFFVSPVGERLSSGRITAVSLLKSVDLRVDAYRGEWDSSLEGMRFDVSLTSDPDIDPEPDWDDEDDEDDE